jgi:hypothetical protein
VGRAPAYRTGATAGEGLSTLSQRVAWLRESGELFGKCSSFSHKSARAAHQKERRRRGKISSAVEMDANRGRTRGRGEVDDDRDDVPEHLKCAVCLGEGRDGVSSRANGPKGIIK